jgi:hypothetical protein
LFSRAIEPDQIKRLRTLVHPLDPASECSQLENRKAAPKSDINLSMLLSQLHSQQVIASQRSPNENGVEAGGIGAG